MPEGPSIVILKEEVASFAGKRIRLAEGSAGIDFSLLQGRTVREFRSWGKHFLICLDKVTVRIHLLLFGSYRINEPKTGSFARLHLQFAKGDLYFYACSVQLITEPLDEVYDWAADVMSDAWDPKKARKKLKGTPKKMLCDAILDQQVFAGAGNIIKNEVLFRVQLHPESRVGAVPPRQLIALIRDVRIYSFEFLKWKKAFVLKKHWQAHAKKMCPRCQLPFVKKHTGQTKRRSFFCTNCQSLYTRLKSS